MFLVCIIMMLSALWETSCGKHAFHKYLDSGRCIANSATTAKSYDYNFMNNFCKILFVLHIIFYFLSSCTLFFILIQLHIIFYFQPTIFVRYCLFYILSFIFLSSCTLSFITTVKRDWLRHKTIYWCSFIIVKFHYYEKHVR